MTLYYEDGVDLEVTINQMAEAIADTYRRNTKGVKAKNGDNSLEMYIANLILEGVLDDEYIEDNYLDDIKDYYENEAYSDDNQPVDWNEEIGGYYNSTRI